MLSEGFEELIERYHLDDKNEALLADADIESDISNLRRRLRTESDYIQVDINEVRGVGYYTDHLEDSVRIQQSLLRVYLWYLGDGPVYDRNLPTHMAAALKGEDEEQDIDEIHTATQEICNSDELHEKAIACLGLAKLVNGGD